MNFLPAVSDRSQGKANVHAKHRQRHHTNETPVPLCVSLLAYTFWDDGIILTKGQRAETIRAHIPYASWPCA
eukprot:1160804-Pelagomonas_calceolata.AAC.18